MLPPDEVNPPQPDGDDDRAGVYRRPAKLSDWYVALQADGYEGHPTLSRADAAVALALASFASNDGTRVRPGAKSVAARAHTAPRTVERSRASVVRAGWLERVKRGDRRRGHANEYRLTIPTRIPNAAGLSAAALATAYRIMCAPADSAALIEQIAGPEDALAVSEWLDTWVAPTAAKPPATDVLIAAMSGTQP